MCSDVDKIDEYHVSELTVEKFQQNYAYSDRPVVIRNASLEWPAMQVQSGGTVENVIGGTAKKNSIMGGIIILLTPAQIIDTFPAWKPPFSRKDTVKGKKCP